MGWKNWPYWLRIAWLFDLWGIVGGILWVLLINKGPAAATSIILVIVALPALIAFPVGSVILAKFNLTGSALCFAESCSGGILPYPWDLITMIIVTLIILFILGALIGLIIGKIKSKKQNEVGGK